MLYLVFGTMLAVNASIGALGYALYGAEARSGSGLGARVRARG